MSRNTVGIEINKILGGPRGWPRLMDLRIIWTVVGDIVHEVQARMDTVRDAACMAHEAYTQLKSMDVEPLDEVVTRLKQQETIDDWINALTAIIEIEHRENLTNVAPAAQNMLRLAYAGNEVAASSESRSPDPSHMGLAPAPQQVGTAPLRAGDTAPLTAASACGNLLRAKTAGTLLRGAGAGRRHHVRQGNTEKPPPNTAPL